MSADGTTKLFRCVGYVGAQRGANARSGSSCRTCCCCFQPALKLTVIDQSGLLSDGSAAGQNHEIGDAAYVKPGRKRGMSFGVYFEKNRPAGHVRRRACDFRSSHAARSTPGGPKIHEHRDVCGPQNFVEQRGIGIDRSCERRKRRLARAAATGIGKVFCRYTVLLSTGLADSNHGHGGLLIPIFAHYGPQCAAHVVFGTVSKPAYLI